MLTACEDDARAGLPMRSPGTYTVRTAPPAATAQFTRRTHCLPPDEPLMPTGQCRGDGRTLSNSAWYVRLRSGLSKCPSVAEATLLPARPKQRQSMFAMGGD